MKAVAIEVAIDDGTVTRMIHLLDADDSADTQLKVQEYMTVLRDGTMKAPGVVSVHCKVVGWPADEAIYINTWFDSQFAGLIA